MSKRISLVILAALMVAPQAARAQSGQSLALSPTFQGYWFSKDIGASSATLAILPLAYALPVSRNVAFDLYTAVARGDVKTGDANHTLQGLVDTHIRASITVTPWAVITGAINLPTGKATHDDDEAIVASALSTELLGFREAMWGTGFGATAGIVTAFKAGNTGVGFGASYRLASEFEPSSSTPFKYAPGDETRVRVALDRNLGNNKLTLGATFQNYSDDQIDGRNLFAPGARWRGDASYSFRSGPGASWTLFATDVWRQNGDVSLQIVDATGKAIRDSTFSAGQQNLLVVGAAGATRLRSGMALRPMADFRLLTRESGESEGWLAGAGTELPMRRGGVDWIPQFRVSYGMLEGATDEKHGFFGTEVSLTLRWGGR